MAPAKVAKSFSLLADTTNVDPALASLFSSSSGPVPPRSARQVTRAKKTRQVDSAKEASTSAESSDSDEESSSSEGSDISNSDANSPQDGSSSVEGDGPKSGDAEDDEASLSETSETPQVSHTPRKRKRKSDDEQLEETYLKRIAREEAAEDAKRKRQRTTAEETRHSHKENAHENDNMLQEAHEGDHGPGDLNLQHETLAPSPASISLDKASRTVFLANVSSSAITSKSAKKTLLTHLSSFLPTLPSTSGPHTVESLRFRSTAFATSIPKKAAFARKEVNDATTKSTNAYAVYSTPIAAHAAPRFLNGTVVLGRHLRVDSVSQPSQIDHRRCVFVGNLGFVDDTSQIDAADAEERDQKPRKKKSTPGDVEEGLWVQFGKAGKVESVRVVRDSKTRVGKGFAYVQFADQNGVEAALLFNDKKFPPLLPRKLRVVRAKNPNYLSSSKDAPSTAPRRGARAPRRTDNRPQRPGNDGKRNDASLRGQMKKLLGKAGVADVKATKTGANGVKPPESFVFEGHRASKQGDSNKSLGMRGSGKKNGGVKPRGRSAKRAAAWKAKGSSGKKK